MPSGFFDRLVSRMDKLNPESLHTQLLRMVREQGFLETIFQTIQEGVLVIDNGGCLVYANQSAEKLVGFDFKTQRGHSMARFLREWDWEHLMDARSQRAGWSSVVTREIEVMYPEHRFVSVYAVPLEEPEITEKSVLIILRDVTDAHRREDSALESERINAVRMLAAGVAHEIGNPLNALNIHLQILSRDLRDEEGLSDEMREHYASLVRVARDEVERLDTIIRQFLSALRPQKPVLRPEQPAEVLRETLQVLQTQLENRRISVEVDVPAQIPTVLLDAAQIKQVFFNLIKNALEAMSDGGRLHILFSVSDSFVDITIRDNGKGIPQEELGRLFEPYHTTKDKGNGLGLMIVKRIVEDHGGEIEVASKEGAGTSFKIRLPLAERRIRRIPS